jgi:hypothetical protein
METIELIIYFGIAVIVGTLLFHFIGTAGFKNLYDDLRAEKGPVFRKVSDEQFVVEAAQFWQSCGLGEVEKTLTLYLEGEGSFNRTAFFSHAKKLNLCRTLQSAIEDCGTKEQVIMPELTRPSVVRLTCNVTSETLVIS